MKSKFIYLLVLVLMIGLSGCTSKNRGYETSLLDIDWTSSPDIKETINQGIVDMSDQLLKNSRVKVTDKVAVATFVDLHKLNKTAHFGRKVSESMFNELHIRGFNLIDVRGTKTIRVNADGEFFITRNIKLLNKKRVQNTYILVGTYSKFGKGILLNARMLDNLTGDVVSTARTIIDINHCDIYENCGCGKVNNCNKAKAVVSAPKVVVIPQRTISISDAGCSYVTCPKNCVTSDCYENEYTNGYINRQFISVPRNKKIKNKKTYCNSKSCK